MQKSISNKYPILNIPERWLAFFKSHYIHVYTFLTSYPEDVGASQSAEKSSYNFMQRAMQVN